MSTIPLGCSGGNDNAHFDLPPSETIWWSPRRKASVVEAVRNGVIDFDEACRRYQLSAEEFLAWQHRLQANGVGGLSVTRSQHYREIPHNNAAWRARGRPASSVAGSLRRVADAGVAISEREVSIIWTKF
jgi:hypothetical protein